MDALLARVNNLRNWQIAFLITAVGFAVFFTGLHNPFMGDDGDQIVNNVPVHSITHIKLFFEGGTFYNGQGLVPLGGIYYRPLMTTVFSLLYTIFGPHPFYFHLLQLLLYIGSAFLLYLFFKYSFASLLSLVFALIFLVHPINSQVVFAIPSMQDALFFFFGILAFWLLLRFHSVRSLVGVVLCLFLSLLAKETGILFVVMALLYLFWFDRKRLLPFVGIMVAPITLYLVLRTNAVGFLGSNPGNAPIDNLSLGERLMTAPSIVLFYLTKLVFPWKLASAYYWIYPTFNMRHVLLPLVIDFAVLASCIYVGFTIRKKTSEAQFFTYMFFAVWVGLGLLAYLQLLPLDMTACETWFYFPMAGVLGMIGIVLVAFQVRIRPSWFFIVVLIIGTLGIRTAIRGSDWGSQYTLASHDITASKEDYTAYLSVAESLTNKGEFKEANIYAQRSVDIYPTFGNYNELGVTLANLGDYSGAMQAYYSGLKYGEYSVLYENIGALTLVYGAHDSGKQFFLDALAKDPRDSVLWTYFAVFEDKYGDNASARVAVSNAANLGQVPQAIYGNIMNDRQFTVNVTDTKSIRI